MLAAMISDYFQERGYNLTAPDSEVAIRHLKHNQVDAVLSDIRMPGAMDGIALGKWIRQELPAVVIVMMSGHTNAAEVKERLGPSILFLSKPFKLGSLWSSIHDQLCA